MTDVITYATFCPGQLIGRTEDVVTAQLLDLWRKIYPVDATPAGEVPLAISGAIAMRAYLRVVVPRPPGNIHARHQMQVHDVPRLGECIATEVSCMHKEMRRDRRYVELETRSRGADNRDLFTARMTMIWSA